MRTLRPRRLLVVGIIMFAIALLGAVPATADVDCADLGSRSAAQAYFEGRAADPDRLDADGGGQACEGNASQSYGQWSLPGLAVLVLGVLVVNAMMAKRQARTRAREVQPTPALVPVQRLAEQPSGGIMAAPGRKQALLDAAPDGSLADLGRALRLVPAAKRMSLVELYAVGHHASPQEVLDALVQEVNDVGVQRWASLGYDLRGQETFRTS
ncbi:MAG: hypothetical protein JWQ93_389 [Marmoricola sp.]|nr:hypothetical protein [Marmoricola sp.]